MPPFTAQYPTYQKTVAESFARQTVMKTIGAEISSIEPGRVELSFAHHASLTQQHGFIHAGIVTTVMDSACGYAAFSLMPEDSAVLTIEFKTNLLAPARGERYRAIGQVKKAGRTISVCDGELFALGGAWDGNKEKLVATMTCTLMTLPAKDGLSG